jgi:hypothetical protein
MKYCPFTSDKPNKKYYIITNDNKKVYFGQAGHSDFTIHKDEARKHRHKKMSLNIGINQELIHLHFGPYFCYGIYQQ